LDEFDWVVSEVDSMMRRDAFLLWVYRGDVETCGHIERFLCIWLTVAFFVVYVVDFRRKRTRGVVERLYMRERSF